jgi:glycosyltransferase involved in cell wall biosynthesis
MDEAGCLEQTHIITDRRFDWPDVLAAMDMSLWLAVQSDGSGRAMLEVMAAGRPVIAAAVGAAPDTIRDGESGLLVPADVGAADLARRVSGLIRDDARRHRLGEAARCAIEARHTLPMQAEAVERVYEAVLRRRSGDR